jgi:hypothetical protein
MQCQTDVICEFLIELPCFKNSSSIDFFLACLKKHVLGRIKIALQLQFDLGKDKDW